MVQHPAEPEGPAPVTDLAAVRRARMQAGTPVRRVANRRFNTDKVARLKQEIDQGFYRIDPYSTADRFIEHERNGR